MSDDKEELTNATWAKRQGPHLRFRPRLWRLQRDWGMKGRLEHRVRRAHGIEVASRH